MRSAIQSREIAMDNKKLEKDKKSFVFNKDDEFYSASPLCYLMHYRNAAIFCGLLEIVSFIIVILIFLNLGLEKPNIRIWLIVILIIFFVLATVATFLMIYGIVKEKPKFIWPLMAFMHIKITILIISAIASITSMSVGLHATHRLFGLYISTHKLENHFGPIWPFNLAVLSFFGATFVVWSYIIIRGAYDYLLDKEYFNNKPSIEMVKTIVVNAI